MYNNNVKQFFTIETRVTDHSRPLGRKSRFWLTLSYASYVNYKKQTHSATQEERDKDSDIKVS